MLRNLKNQKFYLYKKKIKVSSVRLYRNKNDNNNYNKEDKYKNLIENKVPTSSSGRVFEFVSFGAQIAFSGITGAVKNVISGKENNIRSTILSKENADKFASMLCKMRGAALKLGQMISLQDKYLPKEIASVLSKVRSEANVMPKKQLKKALKSELGSNWKKLFEKFNYDPFAAASIGQVHRATLKNGKEVVVKIQYPGVAESIDNDLKNLRWFVEKFDIFPRGMYIDNIIKEAKVELRREVRYKNEAKQQMIMKKKLSNYKGINIPFVHENISTDKIIIIDFVDGIPIDKIQHLPQQERNNIATMLLDIALRELFQYRFMQTDPNWSNFLYDEKSKILNLIDFGSAREYKKQFTDHYLQMVYACALRNNKYILRHSDALNFTTGDETERLKNLHLNSAHALGSPFNVETYDFGKEKIIKKIFKYGTDVLYDRLTPPPSEAYTLHRKLSGCFLSCVKLNAQVKCKKILRERYENYEWNGVDKDIYIKHL